MVQGIVFRIILCMEKSIHIPLINRIACAERVRAFPRAFLAQGIPRREASQRGVVAPGVEVILVDAVHTQPLVAAVEPRLSLRLSPRLSVGIVVRRLIRGQIIPLSLLSYSCSLISKILLLSVFQHYHTGYRLYP